MSTFFQKAALRCGALALGGAGGVAAYSQHRSKHNNSNNNKSISDPSSSSLVFCSGGPPAASRFPSGPIPGLPEYSLEEIARHNQPPPPQRRGGGSAALAGAVKDGKAATAAPAAGGVWVTYKGGVYDVTQFLDAHPGGRKRLLLAAGGAIDPFWQMFTIHNDDSVRAILEKYRIGNVKGYDATAEAAKAERLAAAREAAWAAEPARSSALVLKSARPFCAEAPDAGLETYLTPANLFFVRSHMPVPNIELHTTPTTTNTTATATAAQSSSLGTVGPDGIMRNSAGDFCLQVEGEGLRSACFTMSDLRRLFPEHTITATIQCGGNRRAEMQREHDGQPQVKGLQWTNGAISNATWTGIRLADILAYCALPTATAATSTPTSSSCAAAVDSEGSPLHVVFEGADTDPAGAFAVSVPLALAAAPDRDVLVATHMNGEPLPRDHGYPLRAVVPGVVGVRNCKWLQRVTVQPHEAETVWQQQDYKKFPSYATKPDAKLPSVYGMPIQSALTDITLDPIDDQLRLKGYSYNGDGRGVQRVDLSTDAGRTFTASAALYKSDHPTNDAGIGGGAGAAVSGCTAEQFEVASKSIRDFGGPTGLTAEHHDRTLPRSGHRRDWSWSLFSATLDFSKEAAQCRTARRNNKATQPLPSSSSSIAAATKKGTTSGSTSAAAPAPSADVEAACRWIVCAKAIGADNTAQPRVGDYNFRGLLYNGISCREVTLEADE